MIKGGCLQYLKGSYDPISSIAYSLESNKLFMYIYKIPEVAKTKVSKPEIFYIKVKTLPRPPKTAHLNMPPHVSQCGKICITPPTNFYSGCSNVAAMSWRHCVSFVKVSKRGQN